MKSGVEEMECQVGKFSPTRAMISEDEEMACKMECQVVNWEYLFSGSLPKTVFTFAKFP